MCVPACAGSTENKKSASILQRRSLLVVALSRQAEEKREGSAALLPDPHPRKRTAGLVRQFLPWHLLTAYAAGAK